MPNAEVAGKPLIATLPALPPSVIQPPPDDNVVPLFTAIPPVVDPAELAHKVMSPPLVVRLAPAVTLPWALSKMPAPDAVLLNALLTVMSLPKTVMGPLADIALVENPTARLLVLLPIVRPVMVWLFLFQANQLVSTLRVKLEPVDCHVIAPVVAKLGYQAKS